MIINFTQILAFLYIHDIVLDDSLYVLAAIDKNNIIIESLV